VSRSAVLDELARRIGHAQAQAGRVHPLRVAIDGVDAAGKTTLANELVAPLQALGHSVIRASVDDFHNPREIRYRRGRESAEGYFVDSFDLDAMISVLLAPLGAEGDRRIRRKIFDYRSDSALASPSKIVANHAILLFDGVFLQRDELRGHFDLTIFLDVPFEVTVARMVDRDGADPSLEHASNRRYVDGQRLYLARCRPGELADVVVDNSQFDRPRIVRGAVSSTDPLPRSTP
jgi:uridine kinase